MLKRYKDTIVFEYKGEKVKLYAVKEGVIRVQAAWKEEITKDNKNLLFSRPVTSKISKEEKGYSLQTGSLTAFISEMGEISFYRDSTLLLKEKYRSFDYESPHSHPLKETARSYAAKAYPYAVKVSFEENENEAIYGMGVYQMPYLNLKGCSLPLIQKNTQITIPFYLSSLHYGFLWNNSSLGEASFLKNGTTFTSNTYSQIDYVIVGGDSYKSIIDSYTTLVGKAPKMDPSYLGLWQSKLRYRTPKEVLDVVKEYEERGISLSVIVIDYFHWTRQGEWKFDDNYWGDLEKMCSLLHEKGIKVVASIWPTVDKKSVYYPYFEKNGYLITPLKGTQCYDFQGDCLIADFTNPKAAKFIEKIVHKNYQERGIDALWLDQAEPEFTSYDIDNYIYHIGKGSDVSNSYPYYYLKAFSDLKNPFLIRSAWLGSQKLGALLWSGDVEGTFASMKDQFVSALNAGIAGIAWYTNDIGGFNGDIRDPQWRELLVRWFQWMVFSPILRMHGDRLPHSIPPLDKKESGGGFTHTGQPNEIYSFGEEIYEILKKYVRLREELKPYIEHLYEEASSNGSPLMRTMFYEFEDDPICYQVEDQYMFGEKYLVAPIFHYGERKRKVYLPKGEWKHLPSQKIWNGGTFIEIDAPLEEIPVFEKVA